MSAMSDKLYLSTDLKEEIKVNDSCKSVNQSINKIGQVKQQSKIIKDAQRVLFSISVLAF